MSVKIPPEAREARLSPLVPPISPQELARRYAEAIVLLDAWEADVSSDQDQRETMDFLRQALGPDRVDSSRLAIRP